MNIIHYVKRIVFRVNQKRIDRILEKEVDPNFFFIQVGANDGLSGDPLRPYILRNKWRGLLVEPIPYIFERLVKNYERVPKLFFENSAISKNDGILTMYRVKAQSSERLPWYERTGSLSREHVLKHYNKKKKKFRPENFIEEEKVSALSFSSLLAKYSISRVDFLFIDAEGYDYEIIKMVPFDTVKPRMIWYENKHFSKEDKRACKQLLLSLGYKIIKSKDTFAYMP